MKDVRSLATLATLVFPLGFTLGCSTLKADVVIKASPERVWTVLTELERYPEWNPFFVRATGKLRAGEELTITMQPVGKSPQGFSPTVREVKPGTALTWRGRLFMPGLFDGTHHFRIVKIDGQHVRFSQHEDFSGIFVPFVGFEPYRQGWIRMNAALKRRAEQAEADAKRPAFPSASHVE